MKKRILIRGESKAILLMVVLFFINLTMSNAQNKCVKLVSYDIVEYSKMAVKKEINVPDMSDYDMIKAMPNQLIYHVDLCVDESNQLTTTKTYQKMGSDRFGVGYDIAKIVVSKDGVVSYDFKGNKKESSIEKENSIDTKLDQRIVETFGTFDFVEFDEAMKNELVQGGKMVYFDSKGTPHVFDQDQNVEYIYNAKYKRVFKISFDKTDMVKRVSSKKYTEVNGKFIPYQFEKVKYEKGHSVDRMQLKRITKYLSYSISENGNRILDYKADDYNDYMGSIDKNFNSRSVIGKYKEYMKPILEPKVVKNDGKLNIDIPVFDKNRLVDISIVDSFGKEVYSISRLDQNSSLSLNASDFDLGVYVVNYSNGEESKSVKFVNHKI